MSEFDYKKVLRLMLEWCIVIDNKLNRERSTASDEFNVLWNTIRELADRKPDSGLQIATEMCKKMADILNCRCVECGDLNEPHACAGCWTDEAKQIITYLKG